MTNLDGIRLWHKGIKYTAKEKKRIDKYNKENSIYTTLVPLQTLREYEAMSKELNK